MGDRNMLSVEPKDLPRIQVGKYLLGGVAPRPIAFVSTISSDGHKNLSPFSFFNAFGQNPPVVAFSPSRRGRDNTTKDTYENIIENKECVINAVTYSMVEQMNLASCEFGSDVDEFEQAGFTALDSDIVKPKRVAESPFQIECRMMQMIELGGKNASGNLAICEVVKFHIAEDIIREDGFLDPQKLDHVGRNGAAYYTRVFGDAVFEVPKPGLVKGIGFPAMPDYIKESNIYTANNLGRFGLVEKIPSEEQALSFIQNYEMIEATEGSFLRYRVAGDIENMLRSALFLEDSIHPKAPKFFELTAKAAIEKDERDFAWNVAVYKGMKYSSK